ncbi:hypothetical protein A3K86_07725 [Photobacterium jeanii]|uniref:DUF2066 domain-containing protein n=2 Tax=Photobacterium jeanii TaxID=858640 RepID=A0A178KPI0_9GAMM|nr:hypothetical protein A3K86_07725 [Photobacterium jeanii]
MNEYSMLRFAFLILALLALPINAATVSNLYQAQVVLPDTDKESEQTARQQGLEQVLIKVSGQSQIVENEVVRKALTNSSQYISQFGVGSRDGQQTLDMAFDRTQIHNLLTKANATLWSDQRPAVLVWLVKENNREREIVWDQSSYALQAQMKAVADARGVPMMMPIGDFDDITAVTVPDLWGGFIEPVANASVRYNPEALLIIRARENGENVSLTWQLYEDAPDRIVASQVAPKEGRESGSIAEASNSMVNQIADLLAAKYAVQLGGESGEAFAIRFANIQTTEDFFTLERMLTGLSSVASVNAQRVHADQVVFAINLLSSKEAFKRELLNDRRITQVVDDSEGFSDDAYQSEPALETEGVITPVDPVSADAADTSTNAISDASVTADTVAPDAGQEELFYWQP